jgi:uncharacterized membrane protein YsdA (DUF1294 family)
MALYLAASQPVSPAAWSLIRSPWGILTCWLAVINLITFLAFGFDKLKARYKEKHEGTRRVPEKTLFTLAVLGGSVGALLGMRVWHHKTLHRSFRIGIPLILFLQILIPAGLYLYWNVFHGA